MIRLSPGGLLQRGDVAGQMKNFGTLVTAEELSSVLTDSAPVLVRILFRLSSLFRLRLRWGLRTLRLFMVFSSRDRGWHRSLWLRPGLRLSPGAAVGQARSYARLHLQEIHVSE